MHMDIFEKHEDATWKLLVGTFGTIDQNTENFIFYKLAKIYTRSITPSPTLSTHRSKALQNT